jgi:hypothetical protein
MHSEEDVYPLDVRVNLLNFPIIHTGFEHPAPTNPSVALPPNVR